jgi:hydrogenase maturation protein HypF
MGSGAETALLVQLQGIVQGVGFRPHVHRLASGLGLTGWVRNNHGGVELELHGNHKQIQACVDQLLRSPPPRSRIEQVQQRWLKGQPAPAAFAIAAAECNGPPSALISPDLAICPACLAELADPANRRCGYPFISCTQCGPRYTVLEQVPFERSHTSLRGLPMCQACTEDYNDPANRRFHAQTISCQQCGPQLHWNGRAMATAPAVNNAAVLIKAGAVVAVQGMGGFQLLADPHQAEAVRMLRQRKGRPHKPLAVMASAAWLHQHCSLDAQETDLWQAPAGPILLVRSCAGNQLAAGVCESSPWLGVMRASTGLHQLLLERCGGVLVATSANRSGDPIAADLQQEAALLEALADGVLSHNLPIINRIDDSVMRWAAGGPLVLRLGRGLAPLALPATSHADLALGAESKTAVGLRLADRLVLSPDLGNSSSCAGSSHLQRTTEHWLERHQCTAAAIVCDSHPGYSSSQLAAHLAQQQQCQQRTVQHHHAHLLAVMAEHGVTSPADGVAWDGSGWGDDGTVWGGEAITVQPNGYRRRARLRPFALVGGETAARQPRRIALALLVEAYGQQWRQRLATMSELAWCNAFSPAELGVLERSISSGILAPRTSSIGRLFDGAAALLGLQQVCSFEAQAAIALEGLAQRHRDSQQDASATLQRYQLPLLQSRDLWQWDWQPLLEQMLGDLEGGISAAEIAHGFHIALANGIAALAEALKANTMLLAGGCFQNRVLLEAAVEALQTNGVQALWSQQLPCNDAALPIGQLHAASTAIGQASAACL